MLSKKLYTTGMFCIALLLTQAGAAQSWQFVGSRAMGMGGAGVATAYGPDAQYWNPAGLTQEEDTNETGLLINAGMSLETTKNVLEGVGNLTDMSKKYKNLKNDISAGNNISAEDISTIFKGLNNISKLIGDDTGTLVNADAGVGFKFKNFSVSGRAFGTGSIMPVVDTKNIKFNTGTGLQIGNPSAVLTPAQQTLADRLAAKIDETGTFSSLKTLLNDTTCTTSGQLAVALIDAALSYGITQQQLESAIGTAIDNMPGAAELINQAASATGSYKDNETLAMADTAAFGEVSLGYGMQVFRGIKVGGNFKVISGYTAQTGVMILTDDQKVEDIFRDAKDNKKNTTNVALDLGAMLNLSQLLQKDVFFNPQFGLTARNINGPKFDRPDLPAGANPAIAQNWRTDKYQLKPQIRAGAAVNPFKWMTFAADIDLTENETIASSIKSRQLALGMEFNLVNSEKFNMPLRVGYNKNLAQSNVEPFYTAGIGFDMMHFYIELAGAVSTKTAEIDGKKYPSSGAASLTLGFLF